MDKNCDRTPSKAELDNRSTQLNPNNDDFLRSRGVVDDDYPDGYFCEDSDSD
jgi:hypothetical protein